VTIFQGHARNAHLQQRARSLYVKALRWGWLVRPHACERCSKPQTAAHTSRVVGHHENYAYPFRVVWLCRSCHYVRHQALAAEAA
jgi:RNase P subunit RPR2